MLSYVSIIFLLITLCLMSIQLLSENKNQYEDLATEIHRQFSEMWFVMDGIFIDCPEQHKYFYPTIEGEPCMKIPEKGTEEWDKAICIAEKFRDVF